MTHDISLESIRLSGFLVFWQYLGKGTNRWYCPVLFLFSFLSSLHNVLSTLLYLALEIKLTDTIVHGLECYSSTPHYCNLPHCRLSYRTPLVIAYVAVDHLYTPAA